MNYSRKRRNPYVVGRRIDEPELFFGRESLFEFIKDNLKNNEQVILLHGQRRIGKSSVLWHIPNKVKLGDEFVFVLSDFQHKSQWSLREVVHELANEIVEQLIDNPDAIDLPFLDNLELDLKQDGVKFREFLEQVYEKLGNKKLVLLLDEFDVLEGKNSQSEFEDFFRYLKSIISYEERLFIIPVVGRRLDDMPKLQKNLFTAAPQKRIGLLYQSSIEMLIKNPARESLKYHKEAIKKIIKLSECHPYFTQGICYTLFTQARENDTTEILPEDVNQVIDRTIELLEPGLIPFRKGLPISERIVFSAAAKAQEKARQENKSPSQNPLELLKEFGVDTEHGNLHQASKNLIENKYLDEDGYKVIVEFVRYWLVKYYPLESSIWEFEELESDASDYYKKANIWRERGKIKEELHHYNIALELNPNHFSALFRLAELHLNIKEFLKASELYERAYKVNPERAKDEYIDSLLGAIKLYLEDHKFQKASELYKRACEVNPELTKDEYINLLVDLANSRLNNKELKEASELYEQAYRINPRSVKDKYIQSLLRYGDYLITKEDVTNSDILAEVKAPFEKVLSIDPTNRKARNQLKLLEVQDKKLKQIRTFLAIGISAVLIGGISFFLGLKSQPDPNFQPAPELSVQEKQKRFSSGKNTIFDKTNEENYNNELFSCNQEFQKGKYSVAAECFEQLVEDYPNEPEALIYYNNAFSRKSTNFKVQGVIVSVAVIVLADQSEKYKEMLRGVAQAQYIFNQKEYFSSNPTLLEIVIADDSNDPETSLKIAREIVKNQSILGVIGNIRKEALEVYEAENLAIISPTSTSTELKSEILFRTIDNKILSKKLAEYVKNLGVEKVVIFYNNKSPSSKNIKEYFEFYFDSSKVIREVDLKQQSLDLAVKSAIEAKFEVAILFPDSETVDSAIKIAQTNLQKSKEQQLKLVGSHNLYYCDVLNKGERAVKGLILVVPWFKGTPEAEKFSTEVKEQWGGEVSWLTAASYDATQAFISALSALSNSGENPTRSRVLQEVKDVNIPANKTSGRNLRFSPDGERKGEAIMVEVFESSNPRCSDLDFRQVE
ncbi:MAG: ABC transporter substrate-binding protein [Okeania sp. SIO3B5]|uniref:ABC transporter substrate-binding protein n=1 Tax=Okeania sp. SIO3B5 TaxID=2607811 RepID=UPI001400457D|nr:ABC transporter substrate-binding protein [Okeania sp. SIO3B5]NEO54155.1 ABC transporter substrate-binding protein [Okeania sp. SIO3B5]